MFILSTIIARKKHCVSTLGRWQSKTLLTVDECGSKFARNSVFDCNRKLCFWRFFIYVSSIGPSLASMTSRRQIQDGGPHDVRSKMAAPTTSDPRWRPPRHQDGGPHEIKMAVPVTRSVTPRRVSQRPRPREGSVTS